MNSLKFMQMMESAILTATATYFAITTKYDCSVLLLLLFSTFEWNTLPQTLNVAIIYLYTWLEWKWWGRGSD